MRRADGFGSEASRATSTSTKPPKRSDRLLCNRQAGQFSGSTWRSWPSWQSWWPKGRPQLTATKSTVSASRASEDAEPIEMSVLRLSITFDFNGLAKKTQLQPPVGLPFSGNVHSTGWPLFRRRSRARLRAPVWSLEAEPTARPSTGLSVGYPIDLDINTRDRCLHPVPRHFYLCSSNRFTLHHRARRARRVPHQVRPR